MYGVDDIYFVCQQQFQYVIYGIGVRVGFVDEWCGVVQIRDKWCLEFIGMCMCLLVVIGDGVDFIVMCQIVEWLCQWLVWYGVSGEVLVEQVNG